MTAQSQQGGGASVKRRQPVEIRKMVLEDLPPVFHLGERLFTAQQTPTLYRTWDEYELLNLFLSDADNCLVAESDGVVVGFALGSIISKRRSAWQYGYVVWLGVSPELGGRGVGRRLVQHLTKRFVAAGARMMMVDTEANGPAHRFFEHLGFGDTRPHVFMTMNISPTSEAAKRPDNKVDRPASKPAKPSSGEKP